MLLSWTTAWRGSSTYDPANRFVGGIACGSRRLGGDAKLIRVSCSGAFNLPSKLRISLSCLARPSVAVTGGTPSLTFQASYPVPVNQAFLYTLQSHI